MGRRERAMDMVPQPVRVAGSALATDTIGLHDRRDMLWLEAAARSTREALAKRDANLAKQRADELANVLKEAGVVIYSQTPGAKGGYKEVKTENQAAAGGARPSGSGPRGRVVDADYEESR